MDKILISPGKPRRTGFTLIELLVTIAIVAILIALVFSVGGNAISKAQTVKCGTNLRQIGLAFSQHIADNGGRFPDSWPVNTASWDMQIMSYLDTSGYDFLGVSAAVGITTAVPLQAAGIFKCPADKGSRLPANYARSYSICSWTFNYLGGVYSASLPQDVGIPYLRLQAPARSAVIVENPAPAPNAVVGNIISRASYSGAVTTYQWSAIHVGMSNILFADWHVELIPRPKTVPPAIFYARYFPPESQSCIVNGGPLPQ